MSILARITARVQTLFKPPIVCDDLHDPHIAVEVEHVCPLCGYGKANSYAGHGGLLLCQRCRRTYDPEVETWQG